MLRETLSLKRVLMAARAEEHADSKAADMEAGGAQN